MWRGLLDGCGQLHSEMMVGVETPGPERTRLGELQGLLSSGSARVRQERGCRSDLSAQCRLVDRVLCAWPQSGLESKVKHESLGSTSCCAPLGKPGSLSGPSFLAGAVWRWLVGTFSTGG